MSLTFDVLVIGGGPAGYVAAIRAAQLGFTVACVDEWKNASGKPSLGGTCLNVGCIPSKALLESSENYERAAHKFAAHGIRLSSVALDLKTMLARKDKIVEQLTGGVAFLFKKNKVTAISGHARLLALGEPHRVEIAEAGATQVVEAKHVIVATGSVPRALPGIAIDNQCILDNAGALSMTEVPARLGVVGAGVVGLEMGSVWRRLGAEVTMLEALADFLPMADAQLAKEAYRLFTKDQGLKIQLGVRILSATPSGRTVQITYQDAGGSHRAEFDRLIVAVGRVPNTADLNAEALGLRVDARGFIEVDEHCRTSIPDVYAIGDVVRGPMLAHKAMEEGVAVAEHIAGQASHVDLATVPWVIYTAPEIAWVGETEQSLRASGREIRVGSFPFVANGRAKALGETAGWVKMIADAHTDRILGVHILGPLASEMITEAVVAMEFGASSEDIARIVHAHPSCPKRFTRPRSQLRAVRFTSRPGLCLMPRDGLGPGAAGVSRTGSGVDPEIWYQGRLRATAFYADAQQRHAIQALSELYRELLAFKAYRQRPFAKSLGRRLPPRGVYLYGGVGRGKTMLMDALYAGVPFRRKRRVHFHEFMREVHVALGQAKAQVDPLRDVAAAIIRATRLLCLDEFHVNDIADAMILGRMLEALLKGGVVLVTTSNYAPDDLYPHGLQRDRFLPAIDLLKTYLLPVAVDGDVDFRSRALERLRTYHTPLGPEAEQRLAEAFAAVAPDSSGAQTLAIQHRMVPVRRLGRRAVWFDFAELCGGPRSQLDYLEIASRFDTVMVSAVPQMSPERAAEARRFLWLVDILYEQRVKLILSAQTSPDALYPAGKGSEEFARAVSRLTEMQARAYLESERRSVED